MMSDASDVQKTENPSSPHHIDRKLLEILVCPLTKGPLIYDEEGQELISRNAGVAYPIRNGVPLMTSEAARPLEDKDYQKR